MYIMCRADAVKYRQFMGLITGIKSEISLGGSWEGENVYIVLSTEMRLLHTSDGRLHINDTQGS